MHETDHNHAHNFESDGQPIDAATFIAIACDPARSVLIEACAGSGKTWLLVSRMLRLLLAGAQPSELLAITFTRKAAQEMRERLLALLHELALSDDEKIVSLLVERGLDNASASAMVPAARGLYQRVLASPHGLSVDTFHSWFARLLQIAPLSSGTPHGYTLEDNNTELRDAAWLRFMQVLRQPKSSALREALKKVYEIAGDWSGKKLIDAFMAKRAEWWIAIRAGDPFMGLKELCGADGEQDARLSLWQDSDMIARLAQIAKLLGAGTAGNQKTATAIEQAISAGAGIENYEALYAAFITAGGKPRASNITKPLLVALANLGGEEFFEQAWQLSCKTLLQIKKRSLEPQVLALNQALFEVGSACLEHYQALKAERRVFDFADLEWQAWRLLSSSEHAAYLQSRLDARYKHILLDEFQDTNPLQWHIVRAWLDAYDAQGPQPSVFIVGDPKQSIYRFRRAEPRVFISARTMLRAKGAADLRTNLTRRNAQSIVQVLNQAMQTNSLYQEQATWSHQQGAVWRLPLIKPPEVQPKEATGFALRDPLNCAPIETEDLRHQQEGCAVAQAILHARREYTTELKWSDVMILVRSRVHLAAYERGLREAGIPFVSSRRGGLLDALEVSDLMALLQWLTMPGDNQSLAHALKSPVFGVTDADLIMLAQRKETSWWQALQALSCDELASAAMLRAAYLLAKWQTIAARLPVHDLLDQIMHDGELAERYAQSTPLALRGQVLGNLDAFIALALELDAGRYPSVARFIDRLRRLQRGSEADAPDEADIDAALDAVRIMTIHAAKGLEAEVVVLTGANHSDGVKDDLGVLCDWPEDQLAPAHFSVFGKITERGLARDHLFTQEENFRQQENWNLLYVAITRAKKLFIISGIEATKGGQPVTEGSWYHRLLAVEPQIFDTTLQTIVADGENTFSLRLFKPAKLPPPELKILGSVENAATIEGSLLHALMERLTNSGEWPLIVPEVAITAKWLDCTTELATIVCMQAQTILSQASLEHFFNPQHYVFARNEIEVIHEGELLRFDRLVMFDDALWILDYKRNYFESQQADYQQQLSCYRLACEAIYPDKRICTALITVDGRLWPLDNGPVKAADGLT